MTGAGDRFAKQDPLFYAGDALHQVKQRKVEDVLAQAGLDALLFFKAEAVRYITDFYAKGFRPFLELEYVVLAMQGRPPVVGYVSGSDDIRIRVRSDIADARRLPALAGWADAIGAMLADYGLANGRIGTDVMPFMVHDGLARRFPGAAFVDANPIWTTLTAIKHPLEIAWIAEAVRVADIGMAAARGAVRPGAVERDVAAEAVYAMRRHGSEFEPFIPLVASGANTALFERVATDKAIAAGEMVILDIGAVVRGYTGDLGRTAICGDPSPEQCSIYRATHLALEEAKKLVRPGATCGEIDRRARAVIVDAGWGKHLYGGSTGHQLGYGLHGAPLVDRDVEAVLVENMVMCLEPRIILPDRPDIGGAHLEDVVVVTADGCRQLNATPHDEKLLG
jgi:Xaa-Pro aminopeptidase